MIYTHYSNSNSEVVRSLLLTNRLISFKFALLIAVVGSLSWTWRWIIQNVFLNWINWLFKVYKICIFWLCSVMKSSIRFSENKTLVKAVVWIQKNYFNDTYCICCYFEVDLNILQHFLFFVSRKMNPHRVLKGLKSAQTRASATPAPSL